MAHRSVERNKDKMLHGDLGIVALGSCEELGRKVNSYITSWRLQRLKEIAPEDAGHLYESEIEHPSFLVDIAAPRFGSGEGKGQIFSSVRGDDLFMMVDVCNYSITYKMNGFLNHMSPDDHFQDLKRIIAAVGGKARRITVIMPFLYESRQLLRTNRESLDCAMALQELVSMGVDNIVTFDAHDPRVMNSIPLHGFENYHTAYQFIKGIYSKFPDFKISPERTMVISPDENGTKRAIYMANVLSIDMGMFYKRKDYTKLDDRGLNPIVSHEFLGANAEGRDMIIIDDMISSGDTVLETAAELKKRNAGKIFICATFGVFTGGLKKFDEAYERGEFTQLLTTNLTYQSPELLSRPYYTSCDMSKFIALIIDTMNHDGSVSSLLDPIDRINDFLEKHNKL